MPAIIGSLILLVTLSALLKATVEKYEAGRSFEEWRIWLAAAIVVVVYQLPIIAGFFLRGPAVDYAPLRLLADVRGNVVGLICSFLILFCVQWTVYRVILKDTSGGLLSRRGNFWLSAVPTLIGVALALLIVLAIGGLFLMTVDK